MTVNVVQDTDDLVSFRSWVEAVGGQVVAFDTETTGLNLWRSDFRVRLVQFGDRHTAWVLPVDRQGQDARQAERVRAECARALRRVPGFTVHNVTFDALVVNRHLEVDLDDLWQRVTDTAILAHLCDPRGPEDGGSGQGLKANAARYVDPAAPDPAAELYGEFHAIGHTKETGWAYIDLWNPLYLLYAGLDVILGRRLYDVLSAEASNRGFDGLARFEREVALVCAKMARTGMRVDPAYLTGLSDSLKTEAAEWSGVAAMFGVTSVNAPNQVSAALLGMGEVLTETTDAGSFKVDKEVLAPLADLNRDWERVGARDPNPLAEAVLRAKRASKWKKSYVDSMLEGRDANDRIHPSIASLKARTARMSISGPPLQQLPSREWRIRRAILADSDTWVIGSVDYQAVEMRVIAALSNDPVMIQAILDGKDLHGYTAELVYGKDYSKRQRDLMKGVGFGKLYGGGASTLARQTGAPVDQVKHAIRQYDRVYRGIVRYSRRLENRAKYGRKEVVTPSGRVIPLDRRRLYAATNYVVQSTARDVLAEALLRLDEAGLTEFLRLPVHDEVLFTASKTDAEEVGREVSRLMAVDSFYGVPLATDLEIGGRSWGSLYGAAA
ncbi:DNA polymerase [Actinosynnema sp. NPDC020468]|uniref:DNA polymerase n=1 Tax=Actinosynnema sp. NPDC020468 TaxID=3154488 RepID=UPI0033C6E503